MTVAQTTILRLNNGPSPIIQLRREAIQILQITDSSFDRLKTIFNSLVGKAELTEQQKQCTQQKDISQPSSFVQIGREAMYTLQIIHSSLDKLKMIINTIIEKTELTEKQKQDDNINQFQKLQMARAMLDAKKAQLIELRSETADLRKTADDLEKRQPILKDVEVPQKLNEKEKEFEQEGQQDVNQKDMLPPDQKQDGLDLNNPNLGIISIDDRRYNVNNELTNQGLFTRNNQDYYQKMDIAAQMYHQNDPKYFVLEHLAAVRDIALHPQLMLLASVSGDGTAALTDVSHAVRPTQNDSQQQNISNRPINMFGSQSQNSQQSTSSSFPQQIQSSSSTSLIPIKSLDPKWHFKPSRQQSIKQTKALARQQGKQQTDIQYNQQPLCVKLLPYLESSIDKQRKQLENQITSSSSSKGSQSTQKRMAFDLGCFVMGDNNGKITVMALPDPKMKMKDTLNKLEKNKMFEIDAHSDAVWSIDESSQSNGLFSGSNLPQSNTRLTQTRIVSASADGTVKLWNINTDGIQDHIGREPEYHRMLKEYRHTPSIASSVVDNWDQQRRGANNEQNKYFKPIEQIEDKWEDSDIPSSVIFDPMDVANLIVGYVSGDLVRYDIEKGEYNWNRIGKLNKSERIISLTKSLTATHYQTQDTIPLLVTTNHGYLHVVDTRELQTIFSYKAPRSDKPQNNQQQNNNTFIFSQVLQQKQQNFLAEDNLLNISQQQQETPQINAEQESKQAENINDDDQIPSIYSNRNDVLFTPINLLNGYFFDRLIAAGTSAGKVHIYDLRMGDQGLIRIVGERNPISFHSSMLGESITKIVAHPQHQILVTAGADENIKIFSSTP
ncbi:MAG: hypothetical protein EZS28_014628 [Streblomastix strix]|uniref:Uncharacterized protein n=1 Tax=Streblomastix strix TaxID=222440 RepID=A0A5J4W5F1_9EUKA|nr:MAG: hypothetical protein EZS28_014628 [Streblomastix strix]